MERTKEIFMENLIRKDVPWPLAKEAVEAIIEGMDVSDGEELIKLLLTKSGMKDRLQALPAAEEGENLISYLQRVSQMEDEDEDEDE